MASSKAPNTLKAYAHLWTVFTRWCEEAGKSSLPATSETLQLFAIWAVKVHNYRLETLRLTMSAVRHRHESDGIPSPIDFRVRSVISSLARNVQEEPQSKEALSLDQLQKICLALDTTDPRDIRDRAIILLGFTSGWRRSELAALLLRDITVRPDCIILRLRRSKTDQECKGRTIGIPAEEDPELCPVAAVNAWLKLRGQTQGPLFLRFYRAGKWASTGIGGQTICKVVKRGLQMIGEESRDFGAHSLRAGLVTTAAEAGASDVSIRMRTGHKSIDTMLRYVRPAEYFHNDPLAGVLSKKRRAKQRGSKQQGPSSRSNRKRVSGSVSS